MLWRPTSLLIKPLRQGREERPSGEGGGRCCCCQISVCVCVFTPLPHTSCPPPLSQQGVCVGGGVKCLDLKGERLDQRSCEALEAVLKSLHFDFINLQAAQLEENGAASLLDMMLYYESTTHLDISDNSSMGTLCWRALAHLIKQSVRLSRLDLCNVAVVDYPAQSLSKALLTSRLTELHLHNAQLSGVPLYTLVKEFKYLGVLFSSEGTMEREMGRRIGAAGAVLQSLYRTVVTKRELSQKAKLSVYRASFRSYPHLWS
ncbi:hypothetical protein CesoFtcFv8_016945 [Champsocephalus esox]|uniref:Uncharacterized protein n=1 Tax=Champsocephalus esox TaxID=159716 RepID=A0AAN8GR10_9TELE|nr:hypothetical protein CesoFtcFv8_016945 [Champsocephalus esox]